MSKIVFNERFNTICDEFFKDLITSYPELDQLKQLRSGFTLVKNCDPKSPQRIFSSYVLTKYRDNILSKNEEFFLNNNDIEITSGKKEYWYEFINYIKIIWKTLDNDNKDIIWKYFHSLLILSDKIQS